MKFRRFIAPLVAPLSFTAALAYSAYELVSPVQAQSASGCNCSWPGYSECATNEYCGGCVPEDQYTCGPEHNELCDGICQLAK